MKFTLERSSAVLIRSVSAKGIQIGDETYAHAIAVTAETVQGRWSAKRISELGEDDFADLLASNPEIIVLGTGSENVFAPRELVFAMARRGIGLEVMDTAAAARTFNVLAGEGRRVAAVLYV